MKLEIKSLMARFACNAIICLVTDKIATLKTQLGHIDIHNH